MRAFAGLMDAVPFQISCKPARPAGGDFPRIHLSTDFNVAC